MSSFRLYFSSQFITIGKPNRYFRERENFYFLLSFATNFSIHGNCLFTVNFSILFNINILYPSLICIVSLPTPSYSLLPLTDGKNSFRDFGKILSVLISSNLRRLATVSSAFQLLNFDGSVLQIFISCCNNNDIKQMSNHC